MKRFSILGCIAAALLSFAGCEDAGKDGYEGTNYIYLSSEADKTTIMESDTTPLAIEVMLSTSLASDLTLTFAVNGPTGVVELQNNPVTIKAGEKVASFQIVSLNAGKLTEAANFTLMLDAATVLPESVALKSAFAFVVNPAPAEGELTAEQLAIIAAYKETTGIDLSKYLGAVNVSTRLTGVTVDTYEPFDKTIQGQTIIELSEESTAEVPVLKMTSNAMGIEDHMHKLLKALTIETEEWLDETEYADPCYALLMNEIQWNSNSNETFQLSLDGIKLNADAVEFVGEVEDSYGDLIQLVPFGYKFPAYERELNVIDQLMERVEYWSETATSNPAMYLNCTGITEDDAIYNYGDEDEDGNEYYAGETWIEATASISNDQLVFTFCTASSMDEDYTKVIATYTPNN